MTDAVRPYVFDQGAGRRRLPTWLRTVFVAADGTVFAPAELGGRLAYLFALHDGVRVVSSRRHVYVPTAWRRREYPDTAAVLDRLEAQMRAAQQAAPEQQP
jgi:hypothetical protein